MAKTTSRKVTVIGAGLAGLTTAFRLQGLGFDVEVYEARGRTGGRVFTVEVEGFTGELGGQNIFDGGDAKHLLALIKEFALATEKKRLPFRLNYFDGHKIIDPAPLLKKYQFSPLELQQKLEVISLTARNLKDVLNTFFHDNDVLLKLFSVCLASYEGLSAEKLSLAYLPTLYHMLLGGLSSAHPSREQGESLIDLLWVKDGNARLIEKLSEQLSGKLHLNMPLCSIAKTENSAYQLTFKNGKQVTTNLLVLSMPCSVYEDISIEERVIPKEKISAIRSIPYGMNAKILIPVHPPKTGIHQCTNDHMVTFYHGNLHVLNAYYSNNNSRFTADTIGKVLQKDLPMIQHAYECRSLSQKAVLAADLPLGSYQGPVGHSWPNDPYAKGSYSCIGIGKEELYTSMEPIGDEVVKTLFAPVDNSLFFAGEHVSILMDVTGTMEAAVESGERTARLIKKIQAR